MQVRHIHGLLIAVLAWLVPLTAVASDFESLLREADKIRSSDPARFGELVETLDQNRRQADPAQLQRLQYLRAYRMVVYRNELDAGIKQAQRLFQETNDPDLKFRAGSLVVNSFAINRDFTKGLRYLNQTLAIRHSVKDKDIRHDGVNVAAVLYNQLGQYKLGLGYAQETLSDNPNSRARCFAGHLRAEAQYYLGVIPADDVAIASVIDQCTALGENITANFSRAVQARHWAAQGRQKEAVKLLQDHLPEVSRLRYPRLIAEFRSLLAELKLATGDTVSAEGHARATVVQVANLSSSRPLVVAYRTLYEIAEIRGDLTNAFAHYRQYAEADKAWLNEVKTRELAYQIVRQEMSQKNQQIELLNQQNEVLQLQQRVQEQTAQNTRLIVLLLVLLLASIAFWAYKTKRVQMSLRHMAETDALTGICNRHHFTQQSELALAQCARAGEDVALVMFDLDHFKSINDRYGHDVGDWVLKRVVETCIPICRRIDTFGRIGGEEFAILMTGYDLRDAKRLADDCRVRIAGIDTGDCGHAFRITASFGVTTTALSGYELVKLMSHADKMLYRAKRGGRNRVCVYEIPVPTPLSVPADVVQEVAEPVVSEDESVSDRRSAAVS